MRSLYSESVQIDGWMDKTTMYGKEDGLWKKMVARQHGCMCWTSWSVWSPSVCLSVIGRHHYGGNKVRACSTSSSERPTTCFWTTTTDQPTPSRDIASKGRHIRCCILSINQPANLQDRALAAKHRWTHSTSIDWQLVLRACLFYYCCCY